MAVSHRGAISFGLVHIPVGLYTATQDNDISFRQLCKEDNSRVKYKKTCASCGKEVGPGDIIKGFEYDKDKYVVITDDEFEKIKTEKDRTIQILHFTNIKTIKPIYYEKTYHAVPEAGGEKAFELLRTAMMQEGKIAIAKTVIGTKETLLAIMPTEEGIMVETMYYQDEIKEIPKAYSRPELSEAELTMAKTLISSMDQPFAPEKYRDEYQERLRQLIEQKIAGKEIVAAKPENGENNIIDLMEALKASVDKINEEQAQPKKRGRKKTS